VGQILTPPIYRDLDGPLLFLAGPIQGAPTWHDEAIEMLRAAAHIHIASPRRDEAFGETAEEMYNEQVDWEHYHLDRAARDGVLLFWLAREAEHRCDRAYAQTTRFELGEAVTLHRWQGARVVVGIESGFSNARYLRRTIGKKAPRIPICSALRETCETAIRLAGDKGECVTP
jgi:hypothetical protein